MRLNLLQQDPVLALDGPALIKLAQVFDLLGTALELVQVNLLPLMHFVKLLLDP